jgi:U5 snRNP spliceosome subunit
MPAESPQLKCPQCGYRSASQPGDGTCPVCGAKTEFIRVSSPAGRRPRRRAAARPIPPVPPPGPVMAPPPPPRPAPPRPPPPARPRTGDVMRGLRAIAIVLAVGLLFSLLSRGRVKQTSPAPPTASPSSLTGNFPRALPVEPTVPPAQSPPTVPTYRVVNIRAGGSLSVRAGPGSNYPIVARLRPGTGGIMRGPGRATNGPTVWQEISISGYPGWVNQIYLAPESSRR